MIERGDALSLTQIAALAEVGISAAGNWRKRHRSFPDPQHVEGQELYAVDDVVAWLRERRISQNGLKSTEAPGTTYGDRFLRNRLLMSAPFPTPDGPRLPIFDLGGAAPHPILRPPS